MSQVLPNPSHDCKVIIKLVALFLIRLIGFKKGKRKVFSQIDWRNLLGCSLLFFQVKKY